MLLNYRNLTVRNASPDDAVQLAARRNRYGSCRFSAGTKSDGGGTAEIGFKICDFLLHGKGFCKILLSMLISSLFRNMGYDKIFININAENKRPQHVYERIGFRKIRSRENSRKNQLGELQSSVDYELCRENFLSFVNEF